MASTVSSSADQQAALRAEFTRLAQDLPAFSPGLIPDGAARYLAYYGLDLAAGFAGVRFGLGAVNSGDHRLALHCWETPAAEETILLVHGYFDHVGLYDHLVRFGLERCANVVAFDLPGHGISSGPRAEIQDFEEYRQAIVDVLAAVDYLPGRRSVIAQSTGGAATMDYLQQGGADTFDKVVLLAPLVRPTQWRRIVFLHTLLRRFVDSVARGFADSSQDPEFLDFVRSDPLQSQVIPLCWIAALRRWIPRFLDGNSCEKPLLVVQGDDDNTVDWRYNLGELERLFPAMELFTVPGGRHHLANEHAAIRNYYLVEISAWLDRR